ncbi:glucocorticoid-induced transcript 1 protein-like [Belonocnema kinseyi]|uniref:glucocorticoid-induced transcript 1 protein-like n=1 Tax=Belonocnema kinseyi TaxID=2817044 RepID=UPI00143D02A8|nr:glucocorticoid-induced transcript 1 protein-like [Belonocnema kinseyi]
MSGTSQRMRKSSPCSTSKQGPMRATLPVSSLLRHSRQGSTLRKSNNNSPTVSPTNVNAWRARISPETSSSGQRSPGSLSYKAKSKTLSGRCSNSLTGNQNIRRTASLDTIYLKGQWPRDSYYIHSSLLVDKATQTEEWCNESRKTHLRHSEQQTTTDEKLEKYFRQRTVFSKRLMITDLQDGDFHSPSVFLVGVKDFVMDAMTPFHPQLKQRPKGLFAKL